jgi:hypothetical protein
VKKNITVEYDGVKTSFSVTVNPSLSNVTSSTTVDTNIAATSDSDGTFYLVPKLSSDYTLSGLENASNKKVASAQADRAESIDTSGLGAGYYQVYAVDSSGNVSAPAEVLLRPSAPASTAVSYNYKNETQHTAPNMKCTPPSQAEHWFQTAGRLLPDILLHTRQSHGLGSSSEWTTISVPLRQATTGLSVNVSGRTDTSITLSAISGAEYSKDGGVTWQDSNEFTSLTPGTDYSMTVRYAATSSAFASEPLGSVTVKTKTSAAALRSHRR